jgi:hypothetical protein
MVQHALGQDLSVSRHNAEIGRPPRECFGNVRIAKPSRLKDRQSMLNCGHLDRRVTDLLPAAARPIGLRDDADNLVGRLNELFE